jgi:serine phosphatase RsbU (regulator of sigma subunit)/ABC-type amino acid transport substrate-binding protein
MFKSLVGWILITLFTSLHATAFKVSYDPDYAPFSYSVENKAYGLFIDIWELWAKKNGHTVTFIQARSWDDAIALAREGKVDFFLGTTPYEPWMQASRAYYKTKTALFALKSFSAEPQSIGIIGEDYKEELQKEFPGIAILSYETYDTLIHALLDKKVDTIYDDSIAISYYAVKNRYTHLIKQLDSYTTTSGVHAISAEKKAVEIFDKGFKSLTIEELERIEKNWIFDDTLRYYNNTCFLTKTNLVYVFDPDWKPFEYKDEMSQAHMGIVADILSLISKNTGITFTALPTESWDESVALVKSKKAEMFSAIPYNKERAAYVNFSKHDIYTYPAILISDTDMPFSLENDFSGKTIGIVKGNSLGEWVRKRYPEAHFQTLKNVKEGFEALQNGTIDLFGINGVTGLYYINVLGYDTAKVYTKLDYMFKLKIAVRKEIDPQVLALIDKGIAQIPPKTLNDIYHKWTSVTIRKETDWRLLLSILAASMLIILVFILINKRLNTMVRQKTAQLRELNENLELKVEERTRELALINRKMQESITYASLIQHSILPPEERMASFFRDHFIIWEPKDIVGGDIYFFHHHSDTRSFLFVIDCTGHGVPGAFVTMLVKAIEEQIIMDLKHTDHTPATILNYFDHAFKKLLSQKQSDTNVGFDAAVLSIDTAHKKLDYAGANIPLFYIDTEASLHTLKPDRRSIGYKKSTAHYHFKTHSLSLDKGMKFYLTTDGFWDQNGGKKGFPFGKKRFAAMLQHYADISFAQQKSAFIQTLIDYQGTEERNDDITFIGFEVDC